MISNMKLGKIQTVAIVVLSVLTTCLAVKLRYHKQQLIDFYRQNSLSDKHGLSGWYHLNSSAKDIIQIDKEIFFHSQNSKLFAKEKDFSITWRGLLKIEKSQFYILVTASDDDSTLAIDGVQIIDNSGEHPLSKKNRKIFLLKGYHTLDLNYRQRTGEAYLKLYWDTYAKPPCVIPPTNLIPLNASLSTKQIEPFLESIFRSRFFFYLSLNLLGLFIIILSAYKLSCRFQLPAKLESFFKKYLFWIFFSLVLIIFSTAEFKSGKELLLSFTCTILFYGFLYLIYRYLFRTIENNGKLIPQEQTTYFKFDFLIASLIYIIITVTFFYPCLKSISQALIGPPEDNMHQLWNIWWVHKALSEPEISLSFSKIIFYPEGVSLLYNDFSWYNILLAWPLRLFFNQTTVYNLLILHSFVLSGIGAFLLIKYLTKNSYLGIIGGFIFAFNPSHFGHSLHHMSLASIQFIPLLLLFFLKTASDNSKKNLSLASLFFFLNALCNWNYMIFAAYFIGFSYLFLCFKKKKIFLPGILLKIVIVTGSTLLILSPWLFNMLIEGLKSSGKINFAGHNRDVADFLALFIPDPYHLLADIKIIKSLNQTFTSYNWEKAVYLGIVNILIILLAFKATIKKTASYFCGFLIFLILSWGTFLHISGKTLPIILPYNVIKHIPFLSNIRCPARFIVYVYLFLAIIIAFSLKHLFNGKRRRTFVLSLLIIPSLFIDYYSVCQSQAQTALPPCYKVIKKESAPFAILELPGSYRANERYVMYQTQHEFPIVQGIVTRKTGLSLINWLETTDLLKQKKQLTENKVKYIVIYNLLVPSYQEQYKKTYKLIYNDHNNTVFQVY